MDPMLLPALLALGAAAAVLGHRTISRRRPEAVRTYWQVWAIKCRRCGYGGMYPDDPYSPTRVRCSGCQYERPATEEERSDPSRCFTLRQSAHDLGNMISSLCESDEHAPLLDLDFPATLEPRGRGRGCRLTLKKPVRPEACARLLRVMKDLRLVELNALDVIAVAAEERFPGITGYRGALSQVGFDLTVPARLFPSGTEGHFHLYLDAEMTWEDFALLLRAWRDAGLIEPGWHELSVRRKTALLRTPEKPKRRPNRHMS